MNYTEKQMEQLVEDVRNQLSQLLKAEEKPAEVVAAPEVKVEEKPLVKAEESSSESTAKKAEESSSCKKEESSSCAKEESSLEKSGPAPAPHERPESAKKNPMKSEKAEESESSESKSKDMEKAYKEMSKSERAETYKVLKRFIWEDQGFELKKAEESSSTAKKAEESSSSTAKKAEESTSESTAEKAESSSMSKAEKELETVKAENETLKKNFDQLIASLNKVIVKGPERKSVAGISEIVPRPENDLSSDITEPQLRSRLNTLTKSDKLNKNERDVINNYVSFGKGREDVLSIVKDKTK